ncbi:MAG: thioredoxin family protein [Saprospiraceae bacterium]
MRIALLLLVISMSISAKAEVDFLTDYKQAQAESAKTGKPIFLDAYTTWCAPCKKMEREVFTDPAIKSLLETDFIPLRLDMEKEPGMSLAKQFDVAYYPTLLILNNGKELHRSVGFIGVSALQTFAKTSLESSSQWRTLDQQFERGDRDPALLSQLLAYAKTANIPAYEHYALAYLRTTNKWSTQEGQELVLQGIQSVNTPLFDSLVAQQSSLSNRFGEQVVTDRIARMVDGYLFGDITAKPRKAKKLIRRAYPMASDSTFIRYQMRRAREAGEAKKFGKYAIKSQQKFPTTDPYELEELIYVFEQKLPGWKTEEVDVWRARKEKLQAAEGSW